VCGCITINKRIKKGSLSVPDQSVEDLEIDLLLEGVYRRFGHDFRGYRRQPLRHKLHGLMQADGVRTVSALQECVLHDDAAAAALLRMLAVRPTALFDDAAYYLALRHMLAPWLRSCPAPRIWVAECGAPEEVYSLAILLEEEGLLDKTQIYATSANDALLQEARAGEFAAQRFAAYADNYRQTGGKAALGDYCSEHDGTLRFSDALRSNVTWAQYSLPTDASFNEFQLVTCRGAIAEFGTPLRHRVLQLFYDSMPLLGILSVDQREELRAVPFVSRYKALSAEAGLFQRVA
jgi:chemotaxis protein methyltransferase CheR